MTKVAVITAFSTKKYKSKKAKEKRPFKEHDPNGSVVYTYILKDTSLEIYKIGKTTNPHARFKSLCRRGSVFPIALVNKDIEKRLHDEYEENRTTHPGYKGNGATEWFKKGGKFDLLVSTLDTGKVIPYINIHALVQELITENVISVSDSSTEWELTQSEYGYYFIGLEILLMLGYLVKRASALDNSDSENILLIGKRIAVSEKVLESIKTEYKIYLGISSTKGMLSDNKQSSSRLRKVSLKKADSGSEIFLMLNKVL
mgnify:CR=1 FL=1